MKFPIEFDQVSRSAAIGADLDLSGAGHPFTIAQARRDSGADDVKLSERAVVFRAQAHGRAIKWVSSIRNFRGAAKADVEAAKSFVVNAVFPMLESARIIRSAALPAPAKHEFSRLREVGPLNGQSTSVLSKAHQ